jgi:hypothetical protein
LTNNEAFFHGSQIYDPIALLRQEGETLYVARVGMKTSKRFMILIPTGEPAWPHEPLSSLSDVGWSLRAHEWHLATTPAKTLARLLTERA